VEAESELLYNAKAMLNREYIIYIDIFFKRIFNSNYPFLLIVLFSFVFFFQGNSNGSERVHKNIVGFLPNKGQFPSNVLASAELKNLRLFVEKDGLTMVAYKTDGCHGSSSKLGAGYECHENSHSGVEGPLLTAHSWRINFDGSSYFDKNLIWRDSLPHAVNYLIGSNSKNWAENLCPVREIRILNFYPGIHWILKIDSGFKYDFVIDPGVNPDLIKMKVTGVVTKKDEFGRLVYASSLGNYFEDSPTAWTLKSESSNKYFVNVNWNFDGEFWKFKVGNYDDTNSLIIDPRLIGATYSGSTADNWGFTATYDNSGNMYVGGIVFGPGYPVTLGAAQMSYAPGQPSGNTAYFDIAISKFDSSGSTLMYSTYLGGGSKEMPSSLIFDQNTNSLIVFGKTSSTNFPTSIGAFQSALGGGFDLFVTRLSGNGGFLSSTYLGGNSDEGTNSVGTHYTTQSLHFNYGDDSRGEVNLDAFGNIILVSNTVSSNFPVSNGTLQNILGGSQDGVVCKMSPNLNQLLFSSYIGGGSIDAAYSIKSGGGDTVYIAGSTFSATSFLNNFSSVPNRGHDRTHNGSSDGFLMMIKTGLPPFSAAQLVSYTFVGGSGYDQVFFIEKDVFNYVYLLGITTSTVPVFGTQYVEPNGKHFIQKFSPIIDSLLWSTTVALPVVGGLPVSSGPAISPTAFLVDRCGRIYFSGWGGGINSSLNSSVVNINGLPITSNAIQASNNNGDIYFMVFEKNIDSLIYATFMGGSQSAEHVDGGTSRFSKEGIIYHAVCSGCGGNSDFPVSSNPAFNNNLSSNCNALVFKINFDLVRPLSRIQFIPSDSVVCVGASVRLENFGIASGFSDWQITSSSNVVVFSGQGSVTSYAFTSPGIFRVRLITEGCQFYDTAYRNIRVVQAPQIIKDTPEVSCPGDTILLGVDSLDVNGIPLNISWSPSPGFVSGTSTDFVRRIVADTTTFFYFRVQSFQGCFLNDSIKVSIIRPKQIFLSDTVQWCVGKTKDLVPLSGFVTYNWRSDIDILNASLGTQTFVSNQPRWVYCVANDDTCNHLDSVFLLPTYDISVNLGPDLYFCGNLSKVITATGGSTYLWSTGSTNSSILVNSTTNGFVWVIARDVDGCLSRPDTLFYFLDTFNVNLSFLPNQDTIYAPTSVTFNLGGQGNIDSVYWSFGDGANSLSFRPTHIYQDSGHFYGYVILFSKRSGCRDSLSFQFYVDTVYLTYPNAFTPGLNNINSHFISLYRNIVSSNFQAYDRWGQLVFETDNILVDWDGKQRGVYLIPGTYVFIAKGLGKNNLEYIRKGPIHIVR